MKNLIIISTIFIIIVVSLVTFINLSHNNEEITTWNNGICAECGGSYIYQQAIGHYYRTYYIYICNNCKNLIEIDTYYKE